MTLRLLVLTIVMAMAGCATDAQRKATEAAKVRKEAAKEIARICALPPDERDAEIKRVKEESGMAIYCGGK
jgi:hypothetical protein